MNTAAVNPPLRLGVLGSGGIIRMTVPQMQAASGVRIAAIASRTAQNARRAADELGIATVHDDFAALVADPSLDAVYIALPIALHAEWTIRALQAGKHVLCEKPLTASAAEAEQVAAAAAAAGRLVMEGFMLRHHPQWRKVTEILASGRIGEVRAVQGMLTRIPPQGMDAAARALRRDLAGGVLLDSGCYMVHLARLAMGDEPRRVLALVQRDTGLDVYASAFLEFPSGTASFTCSSLLRRFQRLLIVGTRGSLDVRVPVMPPPNRPIALVADYETIPTTEDPEVIEFGPAPMFRLQAESFAAAVAGDTMGPFDLDNSVASMHVLDALGRSADRDGSWTGVEARALPSPGRLAAGAGAGQRGA